LGGPDARSFDATLIAGLQSAWRLKYSRFALLFSGVITSFADHRTKELFARQRVKGFSEEIQRAALRKLLILDAAFRMEDLRVPPGNRLEALRGDLRGFHSIRVNDQWRIVFRWSDGNASEVRIVDYH
jgi:proteic killer suppression protein